ncbi:hypothetical protein ACFL2M_00400 [Patescibacteria group bacterium]
MSTNRAGRDPLSRISDPKPSPASGAAPIPAHELADYFPLAPDKRTFAMIVHYCRQDSMRQMLRRIFDKLGYTNQTVD